MDQAYENALRRKAEIQKELEEIELFLRLHSKFSSGMNPEPVSGSATALSVHAIVKSDSDGSANAKQRGRPSEFADFMDLLITMRGRPLTRPELVEGLESQGIEIPSDDKPRYLGTILWRFREKFRNLPGHGYWVKGIPYPPAGYDPAKDNAIKTLLESEVGFAERPDADPENALSD
jgi:hypothetical protein